MRVLSIEDVDFVAGGSKESYEAGKKVGEAIVKTANAVLIVAGLIAVAPILVVASS